MMISSSDLKIIKYLGYGLAVLGFLLGLAWPWAIKQGHWLKDYIESWLYVIGALVAFCMFVYSRWSSGQAVEKNKFYNIPNTKQHRTCLAQARDSIRSGKPEEALKNLSEIKIESVEASVTLLSGRWAARTQGQIAGVLEHNDKTFNQINRDVLVLVAALEAEMNTYDKVDKEVRAYLQKRYTNRLEQKLAHRQPINLRRLPTVEGTSDETAEAFVSVSAEDVKAHIAEVFQTAYGRLLITGKPGAGKTILLLQLELALLASETDLLPVVLNLSTWKKDYITLEPWLKVILPAELAASKKYAADILQQNRLILLFDGLDEVAEGDQAACLEAIGRYRAATDGQYAITSRIGAYKAVQKDAPVNLQIEVGDLSFEQMEAELTRLGHKQAEAMPLLQALKKHPLLCAAAQVPFYFNTLQLLFAGGKTLSDLDLKGSSAEAIQEELTPQFVSYALTLPSDKNYSSQQAARWLSFLAHNMAQRRKVVFELSDLQYDWSAVRLSRGALVVANFIFGVAVNLVFGLVFSLAGGLSEGLAGGIFVGISSGLAYGLIFGLAVKRCPSITTQEGIKWSWRLYFQYVKNSLVYGFVVGLIYGLIYDLTSILTGGLVLGFTGSLAGGLVLGLLYGFTDYLKSDSIASIQINRPYQRFNNSAKMLHLSILQHYHLMYLFSKKGWLPWRIAPFLDNMVAQQLLESPDGATWRFRHGILQEHFAKSWGDGV